MPTRSEHLKASKLLLGTKNPLVHDLLDRSTPIAEHRRTHTPEYITKIQDLLGEDAGREAWLHFFMDYGIITWQEIKDFYGIEERKRRKEPSHKS